MSFENVFKCGKQSLEIYSVMTVKTFVFGVNKGFEEHRIYFLVLYGRAVLVEIFSYQHAIFAVQFGSLARFGVHNAVYCGRFSEQPQEIQVYGSKIKYYEHNKRDYPCYGFIPPGLPFKPVYVPMAEPFEYLFYFREQPFYVFNIFFHHKVFMRD